MAEEIAFENGRISNIKGFVTLTLTLNRVILHTVVYGVPIIDLYLHARFD